MKLTKLHEVERIDSSTENTNLLIEEEGKIRRTSLPNVLQEKLNNSGFTPGKFLSVDEEGKIVEVDKPEGVTDYNKLGNKPCGTEKLVSIDVSQAFKLSAGSATLCKVSDDVPDVALESDSTVTVYLSTATEKISGTAFFYNQIAIYGESVIVVSPEDNMEMPESFQNAILPEKGIYFLKMDVNGTWVTKAEWSDGTVIEWDGKTEIVTPLPSKYSGIYTVRITESENGNTCNRTYEDLVVAESSDAIILAKFINVEGRVFTAIHCDVTIVTNEINFAVFDIGKYDGAKSGFSMYQIAVNENNEVTVTTKNYASKTE